ncbi:MAG: hypothetical protein IJC48_09400, partial [Clostridia bacterium]|nr:hypothetical protein [Clostridia bacterium]MBQ4156737.1 hypothetical protein [Clostridia bacterium]
PQVRQHLRSVKRLSLNFLPNRLSSSFSFSVSFSRIGAARLVSLADSLISITEDAPFVNPFFQIF